MEGGEHVLTVEKYCSIWCTTAWALSQCSGRKESASGSKIAKIRVRDLAVDFNNCLFNMSGLSSVFRDLSPVMPPAGYHTNAAQWRGQNLRSLKRI